MHFLMHQVRIHKFLEKTKKQKSQKNTKMEDGEHATEEQEELRKKVTSLMKKQKLRAVNQIVRSQDDSKPWGQDVKAKVGLTLVDVETSNFAMHDLFKSDSTFSSTRLEAV